MGRRGQLNADKRPVIVCFTRIYLLSIHFFQVLLCQCLGHLLQNLLLGAFLGQHNSNHEFGLDSKPKNAIDVSSNNLEVHKC